MIFGGGPPKSNLSSRNTICQDDFLWREYPPELSSRRSRAKDEEALGRDTGKEQVAYQRRRQHHGSRAVGPTLG